MANNSVVTQDTLQTFYDNKVYPYLNGATHTGCVPLGTVLPYYGETAPEHFLICDGTEYLKSDYGELATHLLSLTDPTPYQGSDADHFKVPDLRGEFLRGSGTNSHTNQGSGGDVGEHQDATELPLSYYSSSLGFLSGFDALQNADNIISSSGNLRISGTEASSDIEVVLTRPTNTSVTYIIAYQNAYIDLALDGFPIDITQPQDGQLLVYDATAGRWVNGGHKYSTDEHIVGTWIDGKPIYEKTVYFSDRILVKNDYTTVLLTDTTINKLIDAKYYDTNGEATNKFIISLLTIHQASNGRLIVYYPTNNDIKINGFTIQYTKTTD